MIKPGLEVLRVGLDLDGTIIMYDGVFHLQAVEQFGMATDVPVSKSAVRDWLRRNGPGESGWIELQRLVYGPRIVDANPAPGIGEFLRTCLELGVQISIVSHKTELSVAKPHTNLRVAALRWLEDNGFFSESFGIKPEAVFFESTRLEKISRIASQRCSFFVDDLKEVFGDPAFPASVERWLYAPHMSSTQRSTTRIEGIRVFSNWNEISRRVKTSRKAYVGG